MQWKVEFWNTFQTCSNQTIQLRFSEKCSFLPSLVFIFAMQLCCSMMHQCPFETCSPQLEGESDGIWDSEWNIFSATYQTHSCRSYVQNLPHKWRKWNTLKMYYGNCPRSIFSSYLYPSYLVASALCRTMAHTEAFVNNLCWRLKAFGAPKVHHSNVFLGNGFVSLCF